MSTIAAVRLLKAGSSARARPYFSGNVCQALSVLLRSVHDDGFKNTVCRKLAAQVGFRWCRQISQKTLEDFPTFRLSRLSRRETDPDGFTPFELEGEFDRVIKPVGEITWFWLMIGEREAVCAQWKSFADDGRAATLVAYEKELPEMVGKALYYLSPGWRPVNVWMVLNEQWGWEHVRFQAVDAVPEKYQANGVSIVDGREVRTWTKLQRADKRTFTERYAPAAEQTSLSRSEQQVVPGGWDHEHCQLCRGHIDHGDFGYRDADELWVCESCYDRYVKPHDLSFVDEL